MLVNATGLWAIADASPDRTAVIEPDGRRIAAFDGSAEGARRLRYEMSQERVESV